MKKNDEILKEKSRIELKNLINELFTRTNEEVKIVVELLIEESNKREKKLPRDELVFKLQNEFPFDIGIIFSFFLNYFTLNPGQCLVLDPDEPHSYISGDIVECN